MNIEGIRKLFDKGMYTEILRIFEENAPEIPEEYTLKALSLYKLGQLEEAIKILKDGFSKFPRDKDIIFNLVELLYINQDFQETKKYIQHGINLEQDNYAYYDILASINLLEGENDYAKENAEKAIKFAPVDIIDELKEKYHDVLSRGSSNEVLIKKRKSKNIILVGSACNYGYSFKKFVDDGWNLFVIRTQTWKSFAPNYNVFKSIGAVVIDKSEVREFLKEQAGNIDVVVRTGFFYGGNDLHRFPRVCDIDQIDTFYKVSDIIKKKNPDSVSLMAFDGDSFFSNEEWNKWLAKRLDICDYLLFDTRRLKDYFSYKVGKFLGISNDRLLVLRVEMPPSEDINIQYFSEYKKRILTMGRFIKTFLPISITHLTDMEQRISIGIGQTYREIKEGQSTFAKLYGDVAFGLGYFYDFYNRNHSFEDMIDGENSDMLKSNSMGYTYPSIYGYTNVPGKVITFLQFGIIPVIPSDGNDFHEELVQNGLAVGLKQNDLFFDPNLYPDKFISEMRRNILENADLFTFDKFYSFINSI